MIASLNMIFSKSILVKKSLSERSLPANFDHRNSKLFSHELTKVNPPIYLTEIKDIYVSANTLVSTRLSTLPKTLYSKHSLFKRKLSAPSIFFKALFFRCEDLNEDAMWVIDSWSNNYFHWITDVLPRLKLIQSATSCKTLLLPKNFLSSDFVKSSLRLFDIQKLIEVSNDQLFRCTNLFVVDTQIVTGNYDEKLIKSIRDIFVSAYSTCNSEIDYERIYISRSKASRRKILNEYEIIPVLDKYGFHIVYMEEYSFEEQMRLTIPVKYMISNHGAGMTNMISMQTGGSVFELRRDDDMQNNCYFSLSSALSLNYFYQLCPPEPVLNIGNSTNIVVSPELFEKNIQLMLV